MASIRQEAQDVLAIARGGLAWFCVWKSGKGWNVMEFWPEYNEETATFHFEYDFEIEKLNNIIQIDALAAFVNPYYHNLGGFGDEITRDSLADALRWHYELGHDRAVDVLANCAN